MLKLLMQSVLAKFKDQQGMAAIFIALIIIPLVAFAALAIDIGHLYGVRNELQNGADAGALAGARNLYNNSGTLVNVGANQIAYDTATANKSEKVAVEVNDPNSNSGDVQRGHWSFATRTFTPNASTAPVDLWDVSTAELDANTNFINAVRTVTRRFATPATSYFAKILGHDDFRLTVEAIAYIGYAGTLTPGEGDQPIAICGQSLTVNGEYSCSVGRMINSGQNIASSETGGWTSFNQDNPCSGGTNAQEVQGLVCGSGNSEPIVLGRDMATNGGEIQSAFNKMAQCWADRSANKTQLWNLTLPVINCPSNNVGTCERVVGAVNVNVVWITDAGEDPGYNNAPSQMAGWSNPSPDGQVRWNDFVSHFNLQNVDGNPAPYAKKSIYFLPDCTPHIPAGTSGGENFGILAKIPVLVQ